MWNNQWELEHVEIGSWGDSEEQSTADYISDKDDVPMLTSFIESVLQQVSFIQKMASSSSQDFIGCYHIVQQVTTMRDDKNGDREHLDVTTSSDSEIVLLVPNQRPPFTDIATVLENVLKGNAQYLGVDPWSVVGNNNKVRCTLNCGKNVIVSLASSEPSFLESAKEEV